MVETDVFVANTTTGDQVITLNDGTLTPALVILEATYETAEGITNGNGIFSFGAGTRDGGATQQGGIANFNLDAAGTSATVHDLNTSHLLRGITSDAIEATAIDYSCTLVSFGAGEFTINWDNAPGTAIKIRYWVMGGGDIEARLVKTTTSTAVATQDVTVAASWGQPDALIFFSHGYTSLFSQNDARLMVGFGKSDTERAAFLHTFEDASATMSLASWFRSDACMLFLGGSTSADAIVDLAARASWPTDGFRLAYDDQASLAFHFFALAIKGTFTATIGTAEMQTAGGNQDLALASGTPKGALFVASQVPLTSGTIDTTHADLGGYCVGMTDGTREGFAGMVDDDANTTSRASRFWSESKALARHIADAAGGAAALDGEADSSVSGSNIRLNWSNAPALAADFIYLIVGEAATGDFELDAQPGSYAVTGSVAAPVSDRSVNAAPGSYTTTGFASSPVVGRAVNAAPGSYTVTGTAAGLIAARMIDAAPGSYAISGAAATLVAGRAVAADPGVYTISGAEATLLGPAAGFELDAQPGAYTLSGAAAGLLADRVLNAAPGSYALTGVATSLLTTRVIVSSPGAYAITGSDAELVQAGAFVPVTGFYDYPSPVEGSYSNPTPTGQFDAPSPSAGHYDEPSLDGHYDPPEV